MCKALIEFPVILAHMLSPFCPNLADISASIPSPPKCITLFLFILMKYGCLVVIFSLDKKNIINRFSRLLC